MAWTAFLACLFHLPMDAERIGIARACTGLETLPEQPYARAVGLGLVPICRVCRVCRVCLSAERAGEDIKRGSFDHIPDFSRAKTNPAYTANPARLVKKSC